MKRLFYQFQIDGRPAGPIREDKRLAFADAVNDGYADWSRDRTTVILDTSQGASIKTIEKST